MPFGGIIGLLMTLKKKTFYFVRHAQTDANAKEIMCGGDGDIPLNEVGISQVDKARYRFETGAAEVSKIFVSPMIRTKMTADILNQNRKLPIEIVEGLREWRVGEWEGHKYSELPDIMDISVEPPKGESRKTFSERVITSVFEALEKSGDDTILFVSHGGAAHVLFYYLGVDCSIVDNASITKVSFENDKWSIEKI